MQGKPQAAINVVREADQYGSGSIFLTIALANIHHALGDQSASDEALEQFVIATDGKGPYQIAQVLAYRGEIDKAFDSLEAAYQVRENGIRYLLLDPLLENLHDDPRWIELLDRIGLPH